MKRILAAVLLLTLAAPSWAQADKERTLDEREAALRSFAESERAFLRGDYFLALSKIRPLAAQGYPYAQHALGAMYAEGQGVPQDYKEAVK